MTEYPTEDDALARIGELRRAGRWPGMIRTQTGGYRLTSDPADGDLAAAAGANLICSPSDQEEQQGKSDLPPEPTGEGTL